MEQLNLLYLTPTEAAQLLTDPDPAFKLHYAPGLVEQIIALTRAHPYLLQLVVSNLVKQANAHHLLLATANGQPLPLNDAATTQWALRRLIRYHIMEQVGESYQVEIPLVAQWVRERARLDAEV